MVIDTKKILIISGSVRKKGDGYKITQSFIEKLRGGNNFEWEYLYLNDYEIKGCIGCKVCIRKNEESCPLKDDLLNIVNRLNEADGFIFTSPVYSLAVTSQMKAFIDRTNYLLHRPTLIGKPTIVISTTDLAGTKGVIKYLRHIIITLGMRYTGGLGVKMGAYKNNETYKQKTEQKIEKLALAFKTSMDAGNQQRPFFRQALTFKGWQTRMAVTKDKNPYDYAYWSERGWMDADYFYPTTIKWPTKIITSLLKKRLTKVMKEGFIR